jgi:hypothetical protein
MSFIFGIIKFIASAQCDHGEVWLVDGSSPNEGRIEICGCSWGTVCDDNILCGMMMMLKSFVDNLDYNT